MLPIWVPVFISGEAFSEPFRPRRIAGVVPKKLFDYGFAVQGSIQQAVLTGLEARGQQRAIP